MRHSTRRKEQAAQEQAARLRHVYKSSGLRSQSAFAKALGVTPATVTGWLSAQHAPSGESLDRIARDYGWRIAWLRHGELPEREGGSIEAPLHVQLRAFVEDQVRTQLLSDDALKRELVRTLRFVLPGDWKRASFMPYAEEMISFFVAEALSATLTDDLLARFVERTARDVRREMLTFSRHAHVTAELATHGVRVLNDPTLAARLIERSGRTTRPRTRRK